MGPIDSTRAVGIVSNQGRLTFSEFDYQQMSRELPWSISSHPAASFGAPGPVWQAASQATPFRSRFIVVPHFCPMLVVGFVGAFTGFRRPYQFSLRTLLITITVIAVSLGVFAISI
jgi:hypothetical protein